MSVPTEYDLSQDALIGPMRDILLTAAEPPSGPEFSYPVVDQAVSAEMWKKINRNAGNGILAEGGNPFWYRGASNASNTARITVSTITGEAAAIIHGYYYVLQQDMTVSLPMPSSGTVTYYICLTYDPRRESEASGPISLEVYTGTPPTTFDREHIVLWAVRRSANQLLTDATVNRIRPFVGGVISVNNYEELPDPGELLFGTLAFVRNDRAFYYSFTPIEGGATDGEPYWATLTDPAWIDRVNSTYERAGVGYHPASARIGAKVSLRGSVRLSSGYPFNTGNNNGQGWWVMSLPSNQVPAYTQYFTVATSNQPTPGFATVIVYYTGEVKVFVSRQCNFVCLDGIEFWTR